MILNSNKINAQGATCATAVPISINGACATGTLTDTTADLPALTVCTVTTAFRREGWYTFNVTTGSTNVTITGIGNNRNLYLQLISSTGACAALTQIACANTTIINGTQTETINTTIGNGTYYIKVVNVGTNGDLTLTSLCVTASLPCVAPAQANTFILGTPTSNSLPSSFVGTANGYLVVRSLTNTPPLQPSNGTIYNAGNVATLGAAFSFVQSGASTSIVDVGLTGNTRYYYFIYAFNNTTCTGGPIYNASGPLTGNGITCPAIPNTVTTAGVSSSGFTLNWTAPTGGAAAVISYSIQVTTDAGYTANVVGSPFIVLAPTVTLNVTGLASSTLYYYRILANNGCSSNYVNGNVTTSSGGCAAMNVTYTQNFESAITPAIPLCNSIQNAGTGNNWFTSNNPGYGFTSKTLQYTYNPTNPANAWYYTQGINLNVGVSYRITYRYGSTGATFPEKLKVAYGNAAISGSMTTVLAIHDPITTTDNSNFVDFIPTATGVYYMGFNAFSAVDEFYLFVDDIVVSLSPSPCLAPSQATLFVLGAATSTTLAASFSGTATNYLVIQSTTNIPPIQPVNGTNYNAGNIASLGAAYTFVQSSATTNFIANALAGNTRYYYFIYAFNTIGCTGGPIYNATVPLTGNGVSCANVPNSVTTSGNTSSSFNINWSAPTGGNVNPITYTVQVTTDAAYTVNVAGSPFVIPAPTTTLGLTGLVANTAYYYRILASNGCVSAYVNGTTYTGYCASNSTTSTYYISSFSTTNGTANITNNASGYSATGYGNFTAQVVSQINFGTVSFSANFFNGTNTYGFNIWVDWNNDLDFIDSGELVYASGSYVTSATGVFVVPGTASIGNHRIRIRADYFSTNPSSCGSITNGETEDYTFTVLPPLPCSGNPTALNVNVTSQTTATVSWTAAIPPPANGYQYYLSLSNVTPSAAAIPTGSTLAGITTVNLTGLLSGSSYSIWVRSNCGGVLGLGVWIGPFNFRQPNCNIGPGTGVTALACPAILSGGLGLNGADPAPINSCGASGCTDLEATYLPMGQTTSYNVQAITYAPPYQYDCLKNPVSVNVDDIWSPIINLPFNFCFYGNNYNQCLMGSNGVLTFDLVNNTPGGYSTWSFANNLPNATMFRNTIFGVYHDVDPSIGGEVGWELITLNTGCRALVASWSKIPMFSATCNASLYTGMMVFYENTNVIEVYIQEKNACPSWNAGNAVVGIQNIDGTQATVAPNRNSLDADWTVTNEAWRFTPSGPSITSIKWYEGSGTSGPVVGTTDGIGVCPAFTTTYTAEVTYALCNGNTFKEVEETTVTVIDNKVWDGSVNSDWSNTNNWTPVGVPNAADCVIIPITPNNPVISGSGYNGLGKTLSVLNGASLTINSLNSVTITNWVTVQPTGAFIIENSASLIQINSVPNTGNITYKRNASIRKFDYVYWSSPVFNFNVNNISSPLAPGPIYKWNTILANPNGGQGLWESAAGNIMVPGKGYIVRAPTSFSDTVPTALNGVFTGVPNNGNITIPIYRGSDQNTALHYGINGTQITNFSDNFNLLGNPYPSAIRGSQFLFNNTTKIEGNIKLWTHGTLPSVISSPFYNSFIYNYSPGDFLTFNFTGSSCCPAAGSDLFIGAGQGFLVQMKDGPAGSDMVAFNNGLRSATYDNSSFFRISNPFTNINNSLIDIERNRIWLDIINSDNQSDRTLIGYIEGASMNRDSFFDASISFPSAMGIYSLIGIEKFNIQGRALPFNINDIVPLGVTIPNSGNYKIGIIALDGLFEETAQNIYLEDRTLGVIHNLRIEPYSFEANIGNFENRFFLRYTNSFLGINMLENQNLNAYINNQMFYTSASQNIEKIELFDIAGKLIKTYYPKKPSANFSDNFNFANGVYFAKIKLEDGAIVNKKLMN